MNVWIVDDAIFMRAILKTIIQNTFGSNITIREFSDGKQCLDAYEQTLHNNTTVNLILMDVTMPAMDGITATAEIMKLDASATILLCTGLSSQKTVIQGLQAGAKHFIAKPFIEDQVIEVVENFLLNVEYDENGFVINMDEAIFCALISAGRISDVKGYIRSGFNFSSFSSGKAIVVALEKKENEEMLELFLEHETSLHKKTRNMLKGFRLRQLTNVSWNGRVKQ